ncbi:MAG: PD40 domain-containing protein [Cytophagales bacterium]|nr:PD40 domain-containing protein [Cytophagales bacterium]
MKLLLTLAFTLVLLSGNSQNQLQVTSPPEMVELVGSGFISTAMNERDFALSPDGKEIYFTISTPKSTFQTIVFCTKTKSGWSKPAIAPFAGKYSDLEPAFSADGNTLYFASNRPLSGHAIKDFDIWKVTRTNNKWSEPENLGTTINTASDEFYPSVAKNGNLYFTATYAGGPGREDIYMSRFHQNQYQKPIALDSGVNTKFYEFNAFVSPEEDYIIFTSYGRKDDTGGGDLYISLKDEHGNWKPAKHLSQINSKQLDYCPFVSADGKSLFFTSERHQLPTSFPTNTNYQTIFESKDKPINGTGNIYWVNFQTLLNSLK